MGVIRPAFALIVPEIASPKGAVPENDRIPGRLAGCPRKPNCVSSEAADSGHNVTPLQLKGDPSAAWEGIHAIIKRLPRSTIVASNAHYLHAEVKSRLFRFVDDLELLWDPATDRVAIRSASRLGYSDLGVNRRRVEDLRREFKRADLIC